jgi:hypothetical protein
MRGEGNGWDRVVKKCSEFAKKPITQDGPYSTSLKE